MKKEKPINFDDPKTREQLLKPALKLHEYLKKNGMKMTFEEVKK